METNSLAVLITGAAMGAGQEAPTNIRAPFRGMGGPQEYDKLAQLWLDDEQFAFSLGFATSRTQLKQRWPEMQMVTASWDSGPARGGAYFFNTVLHLDGLPIRDHVKLAGRTWDTFANRREGEDFVERAWRENSAFAVLGGGKGGIQEAITASELLALSPGLSHIFVGFRHMEKTPGIWSGGVWYEGSSYPVWGWCWLDLPGNEGIPASGAAKARHR